jgi:methylmalonyl-CoA mutase C-terminal domain/subunit
MPKRHRIMLAKAGLDGHDRGVRVVAMGLRDANFEVIYTGRRQTPEHIVNAAIQEDVDAIGLSILSGAHMTMFGKILELLQAKEAADIAVFGGGIIPPDDAAELKKMGVKHIFGPGTSMEVIVEAINQTMQEREAR